MQMTNSVNRASPELSELCRDPTEFLVRMSDGVRLATDVYLPSDCAGKQLPTALARLPYGKRGAVAFMPSVAEPLLDRGYAVVVQDVRGKFASEGEQEPFVHEAADGFDTIEWICAQPWSNGRVGMFGDSYYGYTQWAAAASGHPGLRAIVPRVTSTHLSTDWFFHDGAFRLETMADWAALTWTRKDLAEYERDWTVRPLADVLPAWLGGLRSRALDVWSSEEAADPGGAYWSRLQACQPNPARISTPALLLSGAWDVFRRGQFADWRASQAAGQRHHYLSYAPVDHLGLRLPASGHGPADNWMATPDDLAAHMPAYIAETVDFFDEHVGDRSAGPSAGRPRVRFEIPGLGCFTAAQWPPVSVETTSVFPVRTPAMDRIEGGLLQQRPPSRSQSVVWEHNPADLVPSLDADPWGTVAELPDERRVESRPDVVTFTSGGLRDGCTLVGPARLAAAVETLQRRFQLVAKLVHVFPDGFARRIAVGAAVGERTAVGSPGRVVVDLGDLAYHIPPGHHLRLEIAGSSFPRYLPTTPHGDDPWNPHVPAKSVEYRLLLGGNDPTALCLSVVSADQLTPE